jgi:ferrochelatase
MPFSTEPTYTHGTAPAHGARTAVLYCNLGTPDAPTAPALRRYLAEFLSDHRVVEIPKPIWMLILHGIILLVRPKKSAAKYASIWTAQGSPLKVWTQAQATLLGQVLQQRGHHVQVRYAMRYGNPSVASQIEELKAQGTTMILVEQSVNVALSVADRAVFMERGQVRFEGPAQELLERDDLLRAVFLSGEGA